MSLKNLEQLAPPIGSKASVMAVVHCLSIRPTNIDL